MEDDKKEREKGYTFTDKRGLDKETEPVHEVKTDPERESVPKIDFPTLIMSFASASMISMGLVPDPVTGEIQENLLIAQQNIDVISLLREKTRGNVSPDEEKLMEQILYELRMHYVEALKDK
jgi:hypothetical protein